MIETRSGQNNQVTQNFWFLTMVWKDIQHKTCKSFKVMERKWECMEGITSMCGNIDETLSSSEKEQ